jgi:GAF domain-containing protein
MIAEKQTSKKGMVRAWNRLVQVSVPVEGEEDKRVGALFNTIIVVSVIMILAISVPLIVAWRRGYFPSYQSGAVVAFAPFILLPISFISFLFVKRGFLKITIPFYVWFNLILVMSIGILFGGSSSVGWILLFWPVTLAGTLMKPGDTLRFTVISVVMYSLVAWAQGTNRYLPPLEIPLDTTWFLTIAFYWIMLIVVGGIVNYLNVASLRDYLGTSRQAIKLAETVQTRLEERVQERTETLAHRAGQFQAIAELGKVTSTVREERALLNTTVDVISQQMGFYHVAIFLIDPSSQWAILRAASSEGGARMLARGHRLRVGQEGVVGYVSQTGLPRFAFDVDEDAVWFNNPDLQDTKSEIALPLTSTAGVFGVLDIQTQEKAAFDEQDVEVLRVLADNVAIAIENTRLLSETQKTLTRLERYQEQDAVRAWRQALARRNLSVGYAYQSGLVGELMDPIEPSDELAHIDDKDKEQVVEIGESEPGKHRLTALISVGGQPAGHLVFERTQPWSDATLELVESVVTQLDMALTNARLLEETRLRAAQETIRSEIVERVRALTSTDAIMRVAAEELGRALRVERSRIQLVQYEEVEEH